MLRARCVHAHKHEILRNITKTGAHVPLNHYGVLKPRSCALETAMSAAPGAVPVSANMVNF